MTAMKKWVLGAVVAALGVLGIGIVGIGLFMLTDCCTPVNRSLPVYTHDQTESAHPWYRHSTVTCGSAVYVHDFEEAALLLASYDPTNAIGRAPFGNALVCFIEGQKPTDYIAVDCGSEMPAFAVYRRLDHPPFDWRHAQFKRMEFTGRIGRTENKRTTDPALMADLVRTLSEGTPTTLLLPVAVTGSNVCGVHLYSDQLPGLIFCPEVYCDESGPVYVAESMAAEFTNRTARFHARWIPAGPQFSTWVQTP